MLNLNGYMDFLKSKNPTFITRERQSGGAKWTLAEKCRKEELGMVGGGWIGGALGPTTHVLSACYLPGTV